MNTGVPRSAGPSRDTRMDPLFPASNFIREYGAYLNLQRLAAMRINGDRGLRVGCLALARS